MSNSSTPPPPREQRHTPEPWRLATEADEFTAGCVLRADGHLVADCNVFGGDDISEAECAANAARIVACVNALAGFASPATDVPRLIQAAREIVMAHIPSGQGHSLVSDSTLTALRAALPIPSEARP